MGEGLNVYGKSLEQIRLFYVFVFISFIYITIKHRKSGFELFIILLFYTGLFSFVSKNIHDMYKIAVALLAIFWFFKLNVLAVQMRVGTMVLISFLIFSIFFIAGAIVNGDYFTIIFSQYSRFLIVYALFAIFYKYRDDTYFLQKTNQLLFQLLVIQIGLSIIKFFIMGIAESLVGSVASQGGALATSLPILGFMFIWLKKRGNLSRKDWLFAAGLMFIAFVSVKRAIWFVMPVFVTLLLFYVPKKRIPQNIVLLGVLAIPLVFYLGLRLNPTLNPDRKVWGSFDIGYAYNYARVYTFGDMEETIEGVGRGGAVLLLVNELIEGDLSDADLTGNGLRPMYTTDYSEFAQLGYNINHKGSATGIFETKITHGFLGILTMLFFTASILLCTRNTRLRIVLLIFFYWEYIYYTGMIFRSYALACLFLYIVVCSPKFLSAKQVN